MKDRKLKIEIDRLPTLKVEKPPRTKLETVHLIFTIAGVIVSALVLAFVGFTYKSNLERNEAEFSPDFDIELAMPPDTLVHAMIHLVQEEKGGYNFRFWYTLKNLGDKTIDEIAVYRKFDSIPSTELPAFDDTTIELTTLAPRNEITSSSVVLIIPPFLEKGKGFLHITVRFKTALNRYYAFRKIWGYGVEKTPQGGYIATKYWLVGSKRIRLS